MARPTRPEPPIPRRDLAVLLAIALPATLGLAVLAVVRRAVLLGLDPVPWLDGLRGGLAVHLALAAIWLAAMLVSRGTRLATVVRVGGLALTVLWTTIAVVQEVQCVLTGVMLDAPLFGYFLTELGDQLPLALSVVPPVPLALGGGLTLAIAIGAGIAVARSTGSAVPPARHRTAAWLSASALGLALVGLIPPLTPLRTSQQREPVMHLLLSLAPRAPALPAPHAATARRLVPVVQRPKNLVIVELESIRVQSTTLGDPSLPTTPFLASLAPDSLVATNAHAIVPHTAKAMVAMNCGFAPWLAQEVREPLGGLPGPCLPHLLHDQGYRSLYLTSASEDYEHWRQLVGTLGYDDFLPIEAIDTTGYEQVNYFGFEDEVMLGPSEAWLREHRGEPFLAFYLTLVPHADYGVPARYPREHLDDNDKLDRYLNCIRYLDHFLEELVDQYKALGLYDDTVFVFLGDHGQAFAEHGAWFHSPVIYDEALRIPLLFHVPGRPGREVHERVTQLDLLPTVAELMGFRLEGDGPGSSLLQPLPQRPTFAATWYERYGVAAWDGDLKLLHHFGDRPDELFDVARDPWETADLARARPEEVARLRAAALDWYHQNLADYAALYGR